jgi:serine/threonine protein kinase/tetratricopeptide (TPR) repeat protein
MQRCPTCNTCYEDEDISCASQGHKPLIKERFGSRIIANKYRLERLLGRGGMGAVYVATQIKLKRLTALKLLQMDFILEWAKRSNPELCNNPKALEQYRYDTIRRFGREAYAAAQLNHPNVVHVYEYDLLNDDEAYICMELINGQTLQEYLSSVPSKMLPIDVALNIARQVALGIRASHLKGITHRDLKPANILLTTNEENQLLVKIVDFGLAQLKEQAASESALTVTGVIMGTAGYMSPEQCQGQKVDARTDIYSLGIILFEMLAGQRPFHSHNATALALMQVSEPPPALETYRPDTPPEVLRLIRSALEKDPSARPQTMSDFLSQLPEEKYPVTAPPLLRGAATQVQPVVQTDQEAVTLNDYETLVEDCVPSDMASEVTRTPERDFDFKDKVRVNNGAGVMGSTDNVDEIESTQVSETTTTAKVALQKPTAGSPEAGHETTAHTREKPNAISDDSGALDTIKEPATRAKKKPNAKSATVKFGIYLCLLAILSLSSYTFVFSILPWHYSRAGDRNLKEADYAGAVNAYTKALQFETTNAEIYKGRGDAYVGNNDLDRALADYEQAIKLNKDDPDAYIRRGLLFERRRNYQQALADYIEAVRLGRTAESFLKRGNLYNQLSRYDEAIADYSETLKLRPSDHEAYFGRGSAYLSKGLYNQSLQDLNEAIRLSPPHSDYFNNRGNAYVGLKDFNKALSDYDQAIRLDPSNAKAYGNRGNVYFELADYDQALANYDKALQLAPLANVYESRAILYNKLGKDDLGRADFQRAEQLRRSPP